MSNLSEEKFIVMVSQFPEIAIFWESKDWKELDVVAFENAMGYMSSGEVFMAQFFASVWFHKNNKYGFDLVDAVVTLDIKGRDTIVRWIIDPFWP